MINNIRNLEPEAASATTAATSNQNLLPIQLRQPLPNDIVNNPIRICGMGTGFEGEAQVRVRDGNGREIHRSFIRVGSTGLLKNFFAELSLSKIPGIPNGTLEIFGFGEEGQPDLIFTRVPIIFGDALVNNYQGYYQHKVARSETLSSIAKKYYGDESLYLLIFNANTHILTSPDRLTPGLVLRVPIGD